MIYCVDIDGVLVDRDGEYEHLKKDKYKYCYPIQENIDRINKLHDEGHTIILFTARGMSTYKTVEEVYSELYTFTYQQMLDFGVKFNKLLLGKPHYDVIIDDKAINSIDFMSGRTL